MKIALIKLTSLGDVIFAASVLQIIRSHIPDCNITFVADARFADILDHNPDINTLVKIDLRGLKKKRPLFSTVKTEYRRLSALGPFDVIIDMQGMIKSAVIASILGSKRIYGPKLRKEVWAGAIYHHTIKPHQDRPTIQRYAEMVTLCLDLDFNPAELNPPRPFLFWTSEDCSITEPYYSRERRNIIVVAGSSLGAKSYPPEQYAQVANQLQENILVCYGNRQEQERASRIAELSPHAKLLPPMTLNQLKAAMGRADLVIGSDSGPTHIAWGCGTSSITLYGAINPTWRSCTSCGCNVCDTSTSSMPPDKTAASICPTQRNLTITGAAVNPSLSYHHDDSVGRIPPEEIVRQAKEIFAL